MTPPDTCPHCGAAVCKKSDTLVAFDCDYLMEFESISLKWLPIRYPSGDTRPHTCKDRQIERLTAALGKITKLSFKENQEWIPQSIAREALNPGGVRHTSNSDHLTAAAVPRQAG